MTHAGRRQGILAIDTATARVVIASGTPGGDIDGLASWVAGYRHGETLLPTLERYLSEHDLLPSHLTGIVVGTGPGAFTGLRVGIATAKGLAYGLAIPLVGVPTAAALLAAADAIGASAGGPGPGPGTTFRPVLLQPAGPNDRVLVRPSGAARLLPVGEEPDLEPDETLIAVDLEGRAPAEAIARGAAAWEGLGAALIRLGAARLAALGAHDRRGELATVVPEYVTLPRGVAASSGEVAWSRDPR